MSEENKSTIITTNVKPLALPSAISIFIIYISKKFITDIELQTIINYIAPALSIYISNKVISYFSSYVIYTPDEKKAIKKIECSIKSLKKLIKESTSSENKKMWEEELVKYQQKKIEAQSK